MEEIIGLLKEKNNCLRKFYTLNKAEIFRFEAGDFNRVESFYNSRDNILDMISYVEKKIEQKMSTTTFAPATADLKNQIKSELDSKDKIISEILGQDLKILSLIDVAKSDLIKELQDVRKKKEVMGAYGPAMTARRSLRRP